jgi:hypothetical protein
LGGRFAFSRIDLNEERLKIVDVKIHLRRYRLELYVHRPKAVKLPGLLLTGGAIGEDKTR